MTQFVWDLSKELENIVKHGVDFDTAKLAFSDPQLHISLDSRHSQNETRFFCVGNVENKILTVRFTFRGSIVRIIGAGYWRKGKALYEKKAKTKN